MRRSAYVLIGLILLALAVSSCFLPQDKPLGVVWQPPEATVTRVPPKNPELGLGVCRAPIQNADYAPSFAKWGYNTTTWKDVEGAGDNDFDWSEIDAIVAGTPPGKCNVLQILFNAFTVDSIPDWAKSQALVLPRIENTSEYIPVLFYSWGGRFCNDPYNGEENPDSPYCTWGWVVFDDWMINQLDEIMTAMAERYDNDPRVCGILVNVGPYGEMTAKIPYPSNSPDYQKPFTSVDSLYVRALAHAFGVSYYDIIADKPGYLTGYHYYYAEYVKRILDTYARHWLATPVILQIGSGGLVGATVSGGATYAVVEYALHQYPGGVWFKQNGWMDMDTYIGFFNAIVNAANNNWGGYYGAPTGWEHGKVINFQPANPYRWYKSVDNCSGCARVSFACVGSDIYDDGGNVTFRDIRTTPVYESGNLLATPNPNYGWSTLSQKLHENWSTYWIVYLQSGYRQLREYPTGPTWTPTPTWTPGGPTPTNTPTNTPGPSPTPTNTPIPTATNTPGPTPTFTYTPTPVGPSVTLTPSWDTYIDQYNPSTSYGTSTVIKQYDDDRNRIIIKFDVSAVPYGATITRAELGFYASNALGTVDVAVHRLLLPATDSATWTTYDGTNSWYYQGAMSSYDRSDDTYGTGTLGLGWSTIDIAPLVQYWVNGGANYGLILDGSGNVDYVTIVSSEGAAGYTPYLYVEYLEPTPTPTGVPTSTPPPTPTGTPIPANGWVWVQRESDVTTYDADTSNCDSPPCILYTKYISRQGTEPSIGMDVAMLPPAGVTEYQLSWHVIHSTTGNKGSTCFVEFNHGYGGDHWWGRVVDWYQDTECADIGGGLDNWHHEHIDIDDSITWPLQDDPRYVPWDNMNFIPYYQAALTSWGVTTQTFSVTVWLTNVVWAIPPTVTPTVSPTPADTGAPTNTPTPLPTWTPTPTATYTPIPTNTPTPVAGVLINEILVSPTENYLNSPNIHDNGFVELYNNSNETLSVAGGQLIFDDVESRTSCFLPPGTILEPGERFVVYVRDCKLAFFELPSSGTLELRNWRYDYVNKRWYRELLDSVTIPGNPPSGLSYARPYPGAPYFEWTTPSPGW